MMAQEIKVVRADSLSEFTRVTNDLLSEGWRLSGGVSIVFNPQSYTSTFYQGLVREYEQPGAWG